MNQTLRVGIVGAVRGAGFLDGLAHEEGRARLSSVYDPDRELAGQFAHEHGVEAVRNFDELLGQSDLVVLASPQEFHVPQAAAALECGVHVLSEVPAAVSMEQAHELVRAARSSNAVYMLAENYGYQRDLLIVGEMARRGMFGKIYYGEGEYLHEMKSWHTNSQGLPKWRYYWQVGRDGVTYPTHSLGPLLNWTQDRVVAVSCIGTGRHTDREHELQDTVVMLCRMLSGGLVRVRLDLLSNRPHLMNYYSVQGTEGAFESPRSQGGRPLVYVRTESPREEWDDLERFASLLPARYLLDVSGVGHGGSDMWPVRDMISVILGEISNPLDVYDALDITLPGIVSESSIARAGTWVDVPNPRFMTDGIGTSPNERSFPSLSDHFI